MFTSLTARVDKATSDLLVGPDWNMNMAICDSMNTNLWLTKDMVKALKKRLKHRSPKVQILALTLLETMMKNCGDYLHLQISERNILRLLVKIVRKQMNTQVRDKILVLIDTWQEAFGGADGKRPQYYWAYDEIRRFGIQFPERPRDAAPIVTPPVRYLTRGESQAGSEMSRNTSLRLDEAMTSTYEKKNEAMASEMESLSLSNMDSIRSVMDLLAEMLQCVNPNDCEAIKNEVIVDLVNQCRSNQKKLVQFLNSDGDSELLSHGLLLNDSLNNLLAKHDALASGRPLPVDVRNSSPRLTEVRDESPKPTEVRDLSQTEVRDESPRQTEVRECTPKSNATETALIAAATSTQLEEEEEENDLIQLVQRQPRNKPTLYESTSTGLGEGAGSLDMSNSIIPTTSVAPAVTASTNPFALALSNPPPPVRTTMKEQDMIDLLSITLSTTTISPNTTLTPPSPCNQNMQQLPMSPTSNGYPYGSQPYLENQAQVSYGSYVVPWVQAQFHPQPQTQPQFPNYSSSCPPPPWATAQMNGGQIALAMTTPYTSLAHHVNASSASYIPVPAATTLQHYAVVPSGGNNGSAMYGEEQAMLVMRNANPAIGQKAFIPPYRLFEDLDVLGNADRKFQMMNNAAPSLLGMPNQAAVGAMK
ncbi:VHS [Macleaya cordata]|uniref:VHS n=1 Tax=Macleaya cordata TaxID=56857 RepID=A0A200QQD9_MACCD|nr:VHS [Macleaya cordata]